VRRARRRRPEAAGLEVVVTGMGPDAAAACAAEWAGRVRAVVVCGLAGGLGGAAGRGDVVVASRLLDRAGSDLPGVVGMDVVGALRGVVASVERPVDGVAERAALVAMGAVAVETEAAGWAQACAAAGVPLVIVRGVLDTPAEPLGAAAELVKPGARGPRAADLVGLALRPLAWRSLLRLGRTAGMVERRTAEVALRAAMALRGSA
jgi:nucleoside phosphorylase